MYNNNFNREMEKINKLKALQEVLFKVVRFSSMVLAVSGLAVTATAFTIDIIERKQNKD